MQKFRNYYLLSQIFSLMAIDQDYTNFKVYINVQNVSSSDPPRKQTNHKKNKQILVRSSLRSLLVMCLLIGIFALLFWKKENANEAEEYYLDYVPRMPTRYAYEDLQAITKNFNKELGRGGFGTIFEGTLPDGTKSCS